MLFIPIETKLMILLLHLPTGLVKDLLIVILALAECAHRVHYHQSHILALLFIPLTNSRLKLSGHKNPRFFAHRCNRQNAGNIIC